MLKAEKPKIFSIGHHPPRIGSRVKVWFDKKEPHLMVEDETGRLTWDIYGVVPYRVRDRKDTTRCCPLRGVRQPHRNHPHQRSDRARRMIIREAGRSMDFYWNRDKQWPFAGARLVLTSKPWGGFPTSYAVDPVPKPARASP